LVRGDAVHGVSSLSELAQILRARSEWPPSRPHRLRLRCPTSPTWPDVRGQPIGRHALEVAAVGCHHLLMVGPPGSGKTMLAERLPGLLPALTPEESLTVTRVHSAAGCLLPGGVLVSHPPFRAPTTAPPWWPWSVGAAGRCGRVRSHWPPTECWNVL
jgi:magnesium chelatase family protein